MGKFLTTLKMEQIAEGTITRKARFKLTSPLIYESSVLKDTIIVPEGFETDFASVPRLPFVYLLLGNMGNAAACIHDFLYTPPHVIAVNSCTTVTRQQADKVLEEASVDGVIYIKPTFFQSIRNIFYNLLGLLFYIGVRIGGSSHWKK